MLPTFDEELYIFYSSSSCNSVLVDMHRSQLVLLSNRVAVQTFLFVILLMHNIELYGAIYLCCLVVKNA